MNDFPEIYIHPDAEGRITPLALLRTEGTVELTVDLKCFDYELCIFHIATDDFWFNLGFKDGCLLMQRKEFVLRVEPSFFEQLPGNNIVLASWTIDRLTFLLGPVGFQGPSISEYLEIEPRPASLSLFSWARKQSLIPTLQFDTQDHFLSKVHLSLDLLQDKIDEMANLNVFWDIRYEGNKIVSRVPKKETDLHPIIQGLLSDQMFLSSIEVDTEFQTGVGNLDFLFIGSVKDKGLMKICVEFKNAHSKDLFYGLEYQLPAYMKNKRVEQGAYCILDFRCEWFNQPQIDDMSLHAELGRVARRANLSRQHPIKIHHLYLGKFRSASKKKIP